MAERQISRRALLGGTVAVGLGVAVTGTVSTLFDGSSPGGKAARRTGVTTSPATTGYGPLVPDPAGRLDLPEGFRYRVLAEEGVTTLETGEPSPSDPDGAAAFALPDGAGTALVSNHEVGKDEPHAVPHVEGFVYDPDARGGTTTFEVSADGERVRQYVSLAGTVRNCAGGRTPWNTWLSCEETEQVGGMPHGYVFEVDPVDRAANREPRPVKALGRFPHEAVVVDPDTFHLYETEDAREPNGGLYRWTPPADALPLGKGSLRALPDDAGTLEALKASTADGRHVRDLSEATEVGTTYRVEWVEVPDRDAADRSVRKQFGDDQVTRGPKLEGMWWGDGGAYVVSSYARGGGGQVAAHDGQVWFLDPRARTLRLHLRFASTEDPAARMDGPDNITVSPYGGVLVAEDGKGRPFLMGATPSGEIFALAQGAPGEKEGEFCGPTFSADGTTLFLNMQGRGLTFAIEGPFTDQT